MDPVNSNTPGGNIDRSYIFPAAVSLSSPLQGTDIQTSAARTTEIPTSLGLIAARSHRIYFDDRLQCCHTDDELRLGSSSQQGVIESRARILPLSRPPSIKKQYKLAKRRATSLRELQHKTQMPKSSAARACQLDRSLHILSWIDGLNRTE